MRNWKTRMRFRSSGWAIAHISDAGSPWTAEGQREQKPPGRKRWGPWRPPFSSPTGLKQQQSSSDLTTGEEKRISVFFTSCQHREKVLGSFPITADYWSLVFESDTTNPSDCLGIFLIKCVAPLSSIDQHKPHWKIKKYQEKSFVSTRYHSYCFQGSKHSKRSEGRYVAEVNKLSDVTVERHTTNSSNPTETTMNIKSLP